MATLIWAITCQRIIVDSDTNLVTYVDAAEEVHVPQFPFALSVAIGLLWKRHSPGESIRLRLSVHDPDGTLLLQKEGFLNHPVALRHRANLPLAFVAQSHGDLIVTVEQFVDGEWLIERRIPIQVDVVVTNAKPAEEPKA
jgi:hypothetical protein